MKRTFFIVLLAVAAAGCGSNSKAEGIDIASKIPNDFRGAVFTAREYQGVAFISTNLLGSDAVNLCTVLAEQMGYAKMSVTGRDGEIRAFRGEAAHNCERPVKTG